MALGKEDQFSSGAQSCRFVTPWTAAHQASQSITNSRSLLKVTSVESMMSLSALNILISESFYLLRWLRQ